MSGKYKIIEIFQSVQGEGFWAGHPAVFVRFAGCNLECPFCDTDYNQPAIAMTAEEIASQVSSLMPHPKTPVIFTGGEPLLQLDTDLIYTIFPSLLHNLSQARQVRIETNGTIEVPVLLRSLIGWVTVSYKPGQPQNQKYGNELKMLVNEDTVLGLPMNFLEYLAENTFFDHLYFQPVRYNNKERDDTIMRQTLFLSAIHNIPVSFQLHKFLGVR